MQTAEAPRPGGFRAGTGCYNEPQAVSSGRLVHMVKLDRRDYALRALILVAGGVAALLLTLKGQGQALPALAVGGTLGAFVMRSGAGEE